MDYKGWVLAIYDECKSISNEGKDIEDKNKSINLKETLKFFIKKENRYMGILLGSSILVTIIVCFLYLIKKDDGFLKYLFIPWIILFIGLLPEWYKYELNLDAYEKEVNILRNVLKERGLYNKQVVQELYNSTRGVFFNIKTVMVYVVGIVTSSGLLAKVSSIDKVTIKYGLIIVLGISAILAPILYFIWVVMFSIPNSRLERSKSFHQLLKILIIHDKKELEISGKYNNIFNKYKEIIK